MFDNKLTKIKHLTVFSNKLPDLIRLLTSHHLVVGRWIDFETQKNALKKAHTHKPRVSPLPFQNPRDTIQHETKTDGGQAGKKASFLFFFIIIPRKNKFSEKKKKDVSKVFSVSCPTVNVGTKFSYQKSLQTHTHTSDKFF